MGAAIDAIGDAGAALRRDSNILLGAAGSGLILFVGLFVVPVPIPGGFVYGIVVVPVALVGLVAMCDAAIEGSTSLGEFTDGIERHGASAVVAYGVWTLLQFAVVIALVVVVVFAGVGLFAAGGVGKRRVDGRRPRRRVGGGRAAVLVFFLVAFVLGVVQQFLDVAVVLGADGGTEAVKEAVAVDRDGPLSTLGYLLVRSVLTFLGVLPVIVLAAALGVLAVVLLPLAFAVSFAYHVAYYRRRRPETTETSDAPSSGPSGPRPTIHSGRRTDSAARPRTRRPGQQNSCVTYTAFSPTATPTPCRSYRSDSSVSRWPAEPSHSRTTWSASARSESASAPRGVW